jgi:hypothetical protein
MEIRRIEKYLFTGLIGAVLTVIGEMSQGLAETVVSADPLLTLFETHAALPGWRIGFGSSAGAIGILLQYYGVYAIFLSFRDPNAKASRRYRNGTYNYAFVGALIHVLMSVMLYIYKIDRLMLTEFTIWFVTPILVIFFVEYTLFSLNMFRKFRKCETIFPAWCCVLNPLLGKGIVNAASRLIPDSAFSNGVRFSNMGISAMVIFAVLLFVLRRKETN